MPKTEFRKWLDRKKLTVWEFCCRTGIKYETASKWSQGVNTPSDMAREKIQRIYLDCPFINT